jgi:hypothetical protein
VRGERSGALVAAVADHAGATGRVVPGPAFGDTGDEERGGVVAGSGYWVTHVGDPAGEAGDDLHVLPGDVFLTKEQAVVAVAFTDRGDESVDQHTLQVSQMSSRPGYTSDFSDAQWDLVKDPLPEPSADGESTHAPRDRQADPLYGSLGCALGRW